MEAANKTGERKSGPADERFPTHRTTMNHRIFITSLLAGLTLWGWSASAQPAEAGAPISDSHGPGRPRMSFSALDLNGDGSVSEDEFNKARSEMRGERGPGGGPGRGPGNRGMGGPGGGVEKPREHEPLAAPATPSAAAAPEERPREFVETRDQGPRRERFRDGEGAQIRERRHDGAMERPENGRRGLRHRSEWNDRPGRGNRDGGEFRRGPRDDWDRGGRLGRGPGGMYRGDRREMAAGELRRAEMPRGERRAARDGMGPHGNRRGGPESEGVCPHCGRQGGPRDDARRGDGEGRGPRRMAPRD